MSYHGARYLTEQELAVVFGEFKVMAGAILAVPTGLTPPPRATLYDLLRRTPIAHMFHFQYPTTSSSRGSDVIGVGLVTSSSRGSDVIGASGSSEVVTGMPDFSGVMSDRYGIAVTLTYLYYIQQGRPLHGYNLFLRQQRREGTSETQIAEVALKV